MIRIYMADVSALFCDTFLSECIKKLPLEFAERAMRHKNSSGRAQSVGAWLLLDLALESFPGYRGDEIIAVKESGKPYFADNENVFFSLSHSENIAVCAVGQKEIGVDVQLVKSFNDKVCRKYFSENEARYVMSASDDRLKNERFARIWTLKEAFVKMSGEGIKKFSSFKVNPSYPAEYVTEVPDEKIFCAEFEVPGYRLAVCSMGNNEVCEFRKTELFRS